MYLSETIKIFTKKMNIIFTEINEIFKWKSYFFVQNLFPICAYTYTLKTLILIIIKKNNN